MKTAIIYYSIHHSNTKKLLDAIAADYREEVTLIEADPTREIDLSDYDMIGFASGIYYQKFHDSVLLSAEKNLPQNKKVFFIYTCGALRKNYTEAIKQIIEAKDSQLLGSYGCLGWDTFGPFKFIGGIAKGRPNANDISQILDFYRAIRQK